MHEFDFHPLIDRWFYSRFAAPTEPQRLGWPHIAAGENTLIAAPTGSGKTLTAFLAVIDRLLKESIAGQLEDGMRVVYVSPLRALSNDMHRNLSEPLDELNALAATEFPGVPIAQIRAGLRTGDSTSSQRAALVRKPPHILVTTPESLFLLLTAEKGRAALKSCDTVIVDEIHSLIRDKRGSHLALSIERLEALCERKLQRIGLSATQKPIARVAEFLIGNSASSRSIVDVGHSRELDLLIEVPPSELSAVCSTEQWGEINERIVELINAHRSTLIFVNTRRLAERVTHQLSEILGDDAVGSHHGSLASKRRLETEQRLKNGELKAVVATASLELGLDVGYIDLVIQIGSPRSIATFLQRIGRSGHSLGKTPKGRLFALTRDELVECMALIRAVRTGKLDVIPIPEAPIDVLAQQIVGEVACREWSTDDLFALCRRAWPFRDLSRVDFDKTLQFLSEGLTDRAGRSRVYLHHDLVQQRVRSRPGARIAATSNAGAIPDVAEFRVLAEPDQTVVGTLDEDFAIESHAGQIVLLGNNSWRIEGVRGTDVLVSDAGAAPPTIPFWRGEAPGRTLELSEAVSELREELEAGIKALPAAVVADWWDDDCCRVRQNASDRATDVDSLSVGDGAIGPRSGERGDAESPRLSFRTATEPLVKQLIAETACTPFAARQIVEYIAAQIAAIGLVPTQKRVVFERFFDETGGMQMLVHAPFGARITHAWGLAMRKRFCRSFDFELQATADDDGFILSLGPQHSFPLDSMFGMLNCENARGCVEQAILYIPMFQIRWRWNANRALLVLRRDKGRRIPPSLQRFRSDDLLTSVFPLLTGCQENVVGELELPDHILVRQTMHDCLTEALDIEGLNDVLRRVGNGEIEFVARDTREPSPFAYELLNANPYAFLDGGEIAERRARAVATRRSVSVESASDLGRLDPLAIEQVVHEASPQIRSADELHDVLLTRIVVPEVEFRRRVCQNAGLGTDDVGGASARIPANAATNHDDDVSPDFLCELVAQRRATRLTTPTGTLVRAAAERLPAVLAMFPGAALDPPIDAPAGVKTDWNEIDARVAALRGLMEVSGPLTPEEAAQRTGIKVHQAAAGLEALEGEGLVLRGKFRADQQDVEFCHRRLLARIHRLTMNGLRRQIEPVSPETFWRFLTQHHGVAPGYRRAGANGLFEVVAMLEGLDIPALCWERDILPSRLDGYRSQWLDELCLAGEVGWRRLFPPKRDGSSNANLSRVVPVSLFLREDLDWLTAQADNAELPPLSTEAGLVFEMLQATGASFATDLALSSGLPPIELANALGELVAIGAVAADGFGGLRALLSSKRNGESDIRHAPGMPRRRSSNGSTGRWSVVTSSRIGQNAATDGANAAAPSPQRAALGPQPAEDWSWLLLRRWGVVFRELLDREPGAPRWWQLLQIYRRLEARGEIRGGRFISGVAGEQFAMSETVRKLRTLRDEPSNPPADPSADSSADSSANPSDDFSLKTRSARRASSAELREGFMTSCDLTAPGTGPTPRSSEQSPGELVVISAADPLNLIGVITRHDRVPAFPRNRIALQNGRPVATLINGEVQTLETLSDSQRLRIRQAFQVEFDDEPVSGRGVSEPLNPVDEKPESEAAARPVEKRRRDSADVRAESVESMFS